MRRWPVTERAASAAAWNGGVRRGMTAAGADEQLDLADRGGSVPAPAGDALTGGCAAVPSGGRPLVWAGLSPGHVHRHVLERAGVRVEPDTHRGARDDLPRDHQTPWGASGGRSAPPCRAGRAAPMSQPGSPRRRSPPSCTQVPGSPSLSGRLRRRVPTVWQAGTRPSWAFLIPPATPPTPVAVAASRRRATPNATEQRPAPQCNHSRTVCRHDPLAAASATRDAGGQARRFPVCGCNRSVLRLRSPRRSGGAYSVAAWPREEVIALGGRRWALRTCALVLHSLTGPRTPIRRLSRDRVRRDGA